MTRRRKNKFTLKDLGNEARPAGKGAAKEFGILGKDIAIEGFLLGTDMLASIATLGLSAQSPLGPAKTRRRRR